MATRSYENVRHWLKPPLVKAPAPDDRKQTVLYSVSEDYMYTLRSIQRLSPI